jgi:hypothetical protein
MAAQDFFDGLPPEPLGPDPLGLPPFGPPPPPPQATGGQSGKQKFLQLVAGALAAGLGPGKGTGLLHGLNTVNLEQDHIRRQEDAARHQAYQQQRGDWEQGARAYQAEMDGRGQMVQNTLVSLRNAISDGKIKTPEQYDEYVRTYAAGLQARGLRIGEDYFRKNARFIAPGSEQGLYDAIDKALNSKLTAGVPIQAGDKFSFIPPGSKAPVQYRFDEAVPIAGYPAIFRDGKLLVTGDKPTTPKDAMSDAAEHDRQMQILIGAGYDAKDPRTGELAVENANKAIAKRKAEAANVFDTLRPKPEKPKTEPRERFNVQQMTRPDGTTGLVRVNLDTGEATPVVLPDGANSGRASDTQRLSSAYYDRTVGADKTAKVFEQQLSSLGSQFDVRLPNLLKSEAGQRYQQAKDEFINAALRRESGAAIQPSEYDRFDKIYFVMPKDRASTIRQKQEARQRVIDGFKVAKGGLGVTETAPDLSGAEVWARDPKTGKMVKQGAK